MKNWTEKREDILNIPLPEHSNRYGVIPHSVFLGEIEQELANKGYNIAEQRFLTANNGQILTGTYRIQDEQDSEMMPSISFVNSYNRTRKAEIRVSAMILVCKNGMCASTPYGSYSRKHLGDKALPDFREHLKLSIDNLQPEFDRLKKNKEEMKQIQIDKVVINQLVGDMFLNEQLITTTQLGILSKELKYSQNFKDGSLWSFYNNTTESFKENHAALYDKQHIKFHSYISSKFNLTGDKGLYGSKLEIAETISVLEEA